MESLAKFLGFELLSNMVLCIFIGLLLFLTLILTVMVAGQKKKTTLLIQELSLLKRKWRMNDEIFINGNLYTSNNRWTLLF